MSFVVMSDFDGTVVTIDTAEYALNKFADKNWRLIEDQLDRGEITFEESLEKEFAMLKVPESTVLEALEPVTHFRPNFGKLVEYCRAKDIRFVIVSGGLDFCIRHFLAAKGWLKSLEICAPKSKLTANGIALTFPVRFERTSVNFKDDLLKLYKSHGNRVVYIGDGGGDYPPAKAADLRFAIRGSRLAELCKMRGVSVKEITDFLEVVETIDDFARKDLQT